MTKTKSEPLAITVSPVESESEESNIESTPSTRQKPEKGAPAKESKPKKEWVFTEARKAAFERARKARAEMGNVKKETLATKAALREVKKEKLDTLKTVVKVEKEKKEKLQAKLTPVDSSSSDKEDTPLMRAPKKRSKKAKKIVYDYSSSDSSYSSHERHGSRGRAAPPAQAPRAVSLFI